MGTRDDVKIDICAYCKLPFSKKLVKTVDHIVPVSKGGLDIILNRIPACKKCNVTKNHHSLTEFKTMILTNCRIPAKEKKRRLRAIAEVIEICKSPLFNVVDSSAGNKAFIQPGYR